MAGTLVIDTLQDSSSNSIPVTTAIKGAAKAWVQFVGSTAAINGSFNVSSITRSAVGIYVVNFTNAMPNVNYSAIGGGVSGSGIIPAVYPQGSGTTLTTSCGFYAANTVNSTLTDHALTFVQIIGN